MTVTVISGESYGKPTHTLLEESDVETAKATLVVRPVRGWHLRLGRGAAVFLQVITGKVKLRDCVGLVDVSSQHTPYLKINQNIGDRQISLLLELLLSGWC